MSENLTAMSDAELCTQAKAGNRRAGDVLLRRHDKLAHYITHRYRPYADDREHREVYCTVLFGFHKAFQSWEPERGPFGNHASYIARNSLRRQGEIDAFAPVGFVIISIATIVRDDGDGVERGIDELLPDNKALQPFEAIEARQLVRQLPKKEQRVIILHFWHGLTLNEIGEAMKLTRERVRQIRERSLSRMRGLCNGDLRRIGDCP